MTPSTKTAVHIRWQIRRDMPEVLDIAATASDHPTTEDQIIAWVRKQNCIGMVAELNNEIVGYMIYSLEKTRITVLDFAVHADYQGEGVGWAMVDKLKSKIGITRRTRLFFNVRETNLGGQLFLRACGFRAIGVERGGHEPTGEDVYRFVYRKPTAARLAEEECRGR